MDKESVRQLLLPRLRELNQKYHVKQLGIFGSVSRGDATAESDVDILVEFESPIGMFDFLRLENLLSEILGRKVDLITKKAVKPAIRSKVFQETLYV